MRFPRIAAALAAALGTTAVVPAPQPVAAQAQHQHERSPAVVEHSGVVNEVTIARKLVRQYRQFRREPIWIGRMREGRNSGRNAFWNRR